MDDLFDKVRVYCDENNIEYVFATIDPINKYTRVSTNVVNNKIIKRAVMILMKLL